MHTASVDTVDTPERDRALPTARVAAGVQQVFRQREAAALFGVSVSTWKRYVAAGLVCWQRHIRAQVGPDQQGIDHSGGRSGVGEPFITSRRHARQRECGTAKYSGQSGDFLDIRGGIAPNALGIAPVGLIDLCAGNELAIRLGDAEVTRYRLQSMSRQVAR